VLLADLQESSPGYLTTQMIEILQAGEHHPRPAFTWPVVMSEIDPCRPGLVRGGAEQSLDPPLHVEHLDLPHVVRRGHAIRT
jgi:hypothetical protein